MPDEIYTSEFEAIKIKVKGLLIKGRVEDAIPILLQFIEKYSERAE